MFRQLDDREMRELLARNHVGRIAYSFHERVDIEPIHYVYEDGWLYCRTSTGAKLSTLSHRPWIAFEADEVDDVFDWRSVVVHGVVFQLFDEGSNSDRQQYARAVGLLRQLVPGTLADDDPVPFRGVVLGIHVDRMTGRAASSRQGGA